MRFQREFKKAQKEIRRELKKVEKEGLGEEQYLVDEIHNAVLGPFLNDFFQMPKYPTRYHLDDAPSSKHELLVIIGPLDYTTPQEQLSAFAAWSTKWAPGHAYWQHRPLVMVPLEAPVPTLLYAVPDIPESTVAKALD